MIEVLPSGTQPLNWDNYDALDDFLATLPSSVDSMAHSAAYFLHTGRRGLYLVKRKEKCALVALHPNLDGSALVLPAGACEAPELWRELCSRIASSGRKVTLARIPESLGNAVNSADCFLPVAEDKLDWRYPVTILDTERVAKAEGSAFSNFRNKFRQADRSGPISILDQHSPRYADLEVSVLKMITRWAETVSMTKNFPVEHLISSNVAAYNTGRLGLSNLVCRLYTASDVVVGMCMTELTRRGTTANGIAMCVDRERNGCSEYMYWKESQNLFDSGFQRYNTNGSETQSLDWFRSKLQPTARINLQTFSMIGA